MPKPQATKPYSLSPLGKEIVRRGGSDGLISDDDMLVLELIKRMPGMTPMEYQQCFVDLRNQYGEEALYALRNGYVKIEERPGGERNACREVGTE